jgi:hypothetical protein
MLESWPYYRAAAWRWATRDFLFVLAGGCMATIPRDSSYLGFFVLANLPLGVYTLRITILISSFALCASFLLRVFWMPQPTWTRTTVVAASMVLCSGLLPRCIFRHILFFQLSS